MRRESSRVFLFMSRLTADVFDKVGILIAIYDAEDEGIRHKLIKILEPKRKKRHVSYDPAPYLDSSSNLTSIASSTTGNQQRQRTKSL